MHSSQKVKMQMQRKISQPNNFLSCFIFRLYSSLFFIIFTLKMNVFFFKHFLCSSFFLDVNGKRLSVQIVLAPLTLAAVRT